MEKPRELFETELAQIREELVRLGVRPTENPQQPAPIPKDLLEHSEGTVIGRALIREAMARLLKARSNTSVTIAGQRCESLIQQRHKHMDTTTMTHTDAASGTGLFKSSIMSAINSCRVNGSRGEFGQLRIETEELRRELAESRTRASVAEQRVADLTAMLDDVREQRDRWHAEATRLSSAFADQAREAPRWWPWRRSTRADGQLQITHMRDHPGDSKSD